MARGNLMQQEIEVMRVLRTPPLGKLVVALKDQRYKQLSEVTDPHQKQMLLAAIGELVDFVGGYQELVKAGVAPDLAFVAKQQQSETQTDTMREEQARFLARLEAERDAVKKTPPPQPKFPVLSGLRPSIQPQPGTPGSKLSLVEQIDAILQRHIASDPALAERSIHLAQAANGGLQIEVDGRIYQRPRDIEDRQIQLIIKRALKEWESR